MAGEKEPYGRPFTCDACGTSFKHKENILAHIRVHNEDPTFKSRVSYHINDHNKTYKKRAGNGNRPHRCDDCGKSFKQRHHLQEHTLYVHSQERPYPCSECDMKFKQRRDRRSHEARVHKKKDIFCCSECGLKCEQKILLRGHITQYHNGNKKVTIRRFAPSPAPDKEAISVQNNEEIPVQRDEEMPFQSNKENAAQSNDTGTVQRNEEAAIPRKVTFSCGECGAEFRLKRELQEHRIAVHKKRNLVKRARKLVHCSQCGEAFKQRRTLEKHMSVAHGGVVRPSVKKDNRSSSSVIKARMLQKKQGLKKRSATRVNKVLKRQSISKSVFNQDRPYRCQECGNSFKQAGHLQEHLQYVHGEAHTFSCIKCDKMFKRIRSLRMHMATVHDITMPYRCGECGELFKCVSFLRKHCLRAHRKRLYNGGGSSSLKSINQSQESQLHTAHNQNEPFQCGKCDASFALSVSLSRHFKKEHENGDTCAGTFDKLRRKSVEYQRFPRNKSRKDSSDSMNLRPGYVLMTGCNVLTNACPSCFQPFDEYSQLTEHAKECEKYTSHASRENEKEVVSTPREYECSVCRIILPGASCMNEHLTQTHNSRFFIHFCDRLPCESRLYLDTSI